MWLVETAIPGTQEFSGSQDLRICFSNMFSGELIQGPTLRSKDLGCWEVVRLGGDLCEREAGVADLRSW